MNYNQNGEIRSQQVKFNNQLQSFKVVLTKQIIFGKLKKITLQE